MKSSSVWQISILTSREAEEAAVELLTTLSGEPASSFNDLEAGTCRVSVYHNGKPANWPAMHREIRAGLERIKACALDTAPGKVALRELGRKNWAESWKRHFRALRFGRALLIRPTWSRARINRDRAEVVLDPGLSFGTGQHPTTDFCVAQIVKGGRRPGRSFLDVGTGSGILAICAAKLGYSGVVAIDNDPESVRVAVQNARRNRVLDRVRIYRGDVARLPLKPRAKFDLVCANLIANLLLEHRDRLLASVRPSGTLVLAGILTSEFARVRGVFETRGAELIAVRTEKEWQSGAFRVR
jgi:ribosomal protein L11 methyltransferase